MILTTSPRSTADLHRWNYSCTKIYLRTNPHSMFKYLCVEPKDMDALFFLPHPWKSFYALHRVKNKIRDWVKTILQWNIHLKFREESLTNYWLKHPQTRNWGWKSPRADTLVFTDVLSTRHSVALFSPNSRPGGRTFPLAEAWLYLE